MEEYIRSYSSWGWLLVFTLVLLGLYFALGFAENLIDALRVRRVWRNNLKKVFRVTRILFEPVALTIWTTTLVLINPVIHGALLLGLIILTFTHVRNYLSGRLFLLENSLQEGKAVIVGDTQGEVVRMGRLGLKVRSEGSLRHFSYHHVVDKGYVLASGSETGEYHHLYISLSEPKGTRRNQLRDLRDLLATSPYVDWAYEPDLTTESDRPGAWRARIQLRKNIHLQELMELLQESGYLCTTNLTHSPSPKS